MAAIAFSPSLFLSRLLSSSLPAWHFSGRSSNEKFLPSWSRHSRSQPPCLGKVERLGLGGMTPTPTPPHPTPLLTLHPSWSQATAITPAHNAFLQLLTSPPSNQERGEETKDGGLVVVSFILSAGLLQGDQVEPTVHNLPAAFAHQFFTSARPRSLLSRAFRSSRASPFQVQFNEKSPQWFADAQQGKSDVSQHGDDHTLLHRAVTGCTPQSVSPKLLLDSSSSSRMGAGWSPPPLPPTSPPPS